MLHLGRPVSRLCGPLQCSADEAVDLQARREQRQEVSLVVLNRQIARRHLGVTSQRVGQVITLLGLRDSKFHCKAILNKVAGRDRAVVSHLYSPAAVGLIERELKSRGYRRVE